VFGNQYLWFFLFFSVFLYGKTHLSFADFPLHLLKSYVFLFFITRKKVSSHDEKGFTS